MIHRLRLAPFEAQVGRSCTEEVGSLGASPRAVPQIEGTGRPAPQHRHALTLQEIPSIGIHKVGIRHMSQPSDLSVFALTSLANRCARETDLFFQRQRYDPRYCFELFRRAIVDRSQRAWELVYVQYRSLVAGWVQRHPAFENSGEETQYYVNRAFERMWRAIPAAKFNRFRDLKALLRYLQMCAHSVILDKVRAAEQAVVDRQVEDVTTENLAENAADEDLALGRIHRQEFWEQISRRLRDEKERRVVYGSFVLALKPRELYERYPNTFHDVREIYRVKENALARLGRDAELREILSPDA
jgi:DNA-directed RNA polymerase specialized sigma24 family protein